MKKFIHFSMLCLLLAGLLVPMVACKKGGEEEGTAVTDETMTTEPMEMTTEPMDTGMTTDMTTGMTTEPPPAQ
jgi:hypothetical protein